MSTIPSAERRDLPREFPAAVTKSTTVNGRAYHWVRAGDIEMLAQDAAHARLMAYVHNSINGHAASPTDLRGDS